MKRTIFIMAALIALITIVICASAQMNNYTMVSSFENFTWNSTESDIISTFQQLPDVNVSVTYDQNGRVISVKRVTSEKYELIYFHVTKENGRIWGIEGFFQYAECCEHSRIYNELIDKFALIYKYPYQDQILSSYTVGADQSMMAADEDTIYVISEKETSDMNLPYMYAFFIDRAYWES